MFGLAVDLQSAKLKSVLALPTAPLPKAPLSAACLDRAPQPFAHPFEMPDECMGIAVACDASRPDARPRDGHILA
jgi:hypothetical protein